MSLNLEEDEESEELLSQQRKQQPTPQNTQRHKKQEAKDLAYRFIDAITSGQEPLSQLCSVLKARGFLLEDELEPNYDPNHIYLSNNSHANDALYVDKLLRENEIGCIFSDDSPYQGRDYQEQIIPLPLQRREVFVTGEITKESLLNIFSGHKHCGGEAGTIQEWEYCESRKLFDEFKNREYGPRIEVDRLDSYIARLVKTLNAIGNATQYSCHGGLSKKKPPLIQLVSVYDYIWLAILMEKFVISQKKLTNKWQIGEVPQERVVNALKIKSPENDWLNFYLEIQNVAEILYSKRTDLRIYKKEFFRELSFENWTRRVDFKVQNSSIFYRDFLSGLRYHSNHSFMEE